MGMEIAPDSLQARNNCNFVVAPAERFLAVRQRTVSSRGVLARPASQVFYWQ